MYIKGTSILSIFLLLLYLRKGDYRLFLSGRRMAIVVSFLIIIATFILVNELISGNFNIDYVAHHTSLETPTIYKFSALWAGQSGSLLFWLFILSIFSLIAILAISCSADKRSADLVLDSLQCLMCSVNVEESLLSLKGVKKIKVDLKNKSGHVVYNANVIDLSAIEKRITSIGYSVNGKYADKNAYNKLEICCKKPEDN